MVNFFENIQKVNSSEDNEEIFDDDNISIFSLLPAYALSEIKSAFIIGFYIYLPFVVVELVISSVLLTLGMMMMSPVTISTPIKLILFVAMDGWTMLSKGLILQYFVCRTYRSCDICWFISRAFSNGNTVARTDVAIWREIIMRKYLLFFNERMVWRKIIFFWY